MLEKQYSRIIRWVHRAQAMSADGNFSDAILDVECARAELDDARQELLLCHKDGAPQRRIPKFLLGIPSAVVAVMIWAMPLCIEPDMTRFTAVPNRPSDLCCVLSRQKLSRLSRSSYRRFTMMK